MRILIMPDSYKGSLTATDAARAMGSGVRQIFPEADIELLPIADGGEGTVETLVEATGGRLEHCMVTGPLGEPVRAVWGVLGDGVTAVIEMASAAGLPLIKDSQKNPLIATSYGVGELIRAALDADMEKFIIGIGGSATNDGGAGFAAALGARFKDAEGNDLPLGGAALARLACIDISGLDPRLAGKDILVACDVKNPLCGACGASAVFGPQKGATPAMIAELDAALAHYAGIAEKTCGKTIMDYPGAGAAGGLGAGLMLFTDAVLRPGIQLILQTMRVEEKLRDADLVFTGEGNTDYQTCFGKAPVGVSTLARKYSVPTICISGGIGRDYENIYEYGISAVLPIVNQPMPLEDCMERAEALLIDATSRACRLIRAGMHLEGRSASERTRRDDADIQKKRAADSHADQRGYT